MSAETEKIESIWPDDAEQELKSAARLPDGSEFSSWEVSITFSRTWIVDQNHESADDANPGTEDQPLLTINAAANRAQPGERVVIKAGVYRECVRPVRGGSSPDMLISFEAAEGEDVVVDGAEIVDGEWKESEGWGRNRSRDESGTKIWMVRLPREGFVGSNPFTIPNKTIAVSGGGFDITKVDRVELYMLRRGMLFQDGRIMKQVSNHSELYESPGALFPDPKGLILHVRPFDDADPGDHSFEATAREQWFCPDEIISALKG